MRTIFHTGSKKSQRGASLVEFTIAATVFLTVTFAVLEFGRALWVYNALADAARKGARYAVVHDSARNRWQPGRDIGEGGLHNS